jgi:hypothetical protein
MEQPLRAGLDAGLLFLGAAEGVDGGTFVGSEGQARVDWCVPCYYRRQLTSTTR